METFYLTRKQMAGLLLSLNGNTDKPPIAVLQEAWAKSHKTDMEHGKTLGAFVSTSLPPIFEKIIKMKRTGEGFSLTDIVALGNQIEYSQYSATAMQNWVKRDFKELIGAPRIGKKYSFDQTATLFIIDDLKATLDFESIRKMLTLVFNNPEDETDDLIGPLRLYAAYSALFEELDQNNDQVLDLSGHESGLRNHDHMLEHLLKKMADKFADTLAGLNRDQKEAVSNTVFVAMVSVQTSYFQSLARRYLNATLFLRNLNGGS
ncbi:DUF1836 domain-containing protein [Paenibacillus flagellatus]|uniref:DUF1836 domain-containing protein n=1 Tax=Paenibacillus flagellatus TaxID=2211139 RepID=A0A2V5JUW4_9BACL|nr:DUF1836 domain-containing protein [Paenibacillus flagellatus]PYI50328.1 hypothetical protein DLM86_30030 [Paenibacillus flagellatus]